MIIFSGGTPIKQKEGKIIIVIGVSVSIIEQERVIAIACGKSII